MLPHIIHYCWFGKNPLDEKAKKCIASWEKFFPGWEIIQWNEDNFDITQYDFMVKAYEQKKWAFVSDVARLLVVYQYGGIYFDTDVEVIRSFEDIIQAIDQGFMGKDHQDYINTGLGFGAEKGHPFLLNLLKVYERLEYDEYKEKLGSIACPILTNQYLASVGIDAKRLNSDVFGIRIYPCEFFNPVDHLTGVCKLSKDTHSIHWYSDSWNNKEQKNSKLRYQKYRRIFGKNGEILAGIVECAEREGIVNYVLRRIRRRKQ